MVLYNDISLDSFSDWMWWIAISIIRLAECSPDASGDIEHFLQQKVLEINTGNFLCYGLSNIGIEFWESFSESFY